MRTRSSYRATILLLSSRYVLAVDVLEPRVVLAQVVHSVVVAVRRSDNRVNVRARRLIGGERNARLMIEFDQHHRTVDAVIEDVFVADATHPQEIRFIEVLTNGAEPDFGVSRPEF